MSKFRYKLYRKHNYVLFMIPTLRMTIRKIGFRFNENVMFHSNLHPSSRANCSETKFELSAPH